MSEKICSSVIGKIEAICDKFGNKPGELINILHEAQHTVGYLPMEVQAVIARKLLQAHMRPRLPDRFQSVWELPAMLEVPRRFWKNSREPWA